MRILLKDLQTGLFYVSPGQWTKDNTEAYNFHAGDQAFEMARKCRLTEAATLYVFSDQTMDFSIRIMTGGK
jgi:hypothetical protein